MQKKNNKSGKSGIGKHRADIDAVDNNIIRLLEQRAELAKKIGEEKRAAGEKTYLAPEREAALLRRVLEESKKHGGNLQPHIPAIYREILSACLACELPASAAYLGPAGTYSHQAALKMFGHAAQFVAAPSIGAAFRAAESEKTNFAVVPFENSSAGTVGETTDALAKTSLNIVGEYFLRIRHKLLAPKKLAKQNAADFAEIFGHPQALAQCQSWLDANAPKAARRPAGSTAQAGELAKKAKNAAAIGSTLTQEIYNLAAIAADLEDFSNNSTRFLSLGRAAAPPCGDDKTSFIMTARDESGAMYKLLQPLAKNNVSMTKLESRPARGRLWEYLFFVDISGHQQDAAAAAALEEIGRRAAMLKILGSYPRAVE